MYIYIVFRDTDKSELRAPPNPKAPGLESFDCTLNNTVIHLAVKKNKIRGGGDNYTFLTDID